MPDFDKSIEAWYEISITLPEEVVDATSNFIVENLASGLVLEQEEDSPYTLVKFYLPTNDPRDFRSLLTNFLSGINNDLLDSVPEIKQRKVNNIEWTEEYKKSVKPIQVMDITVRPPWSEQDKESSYDIIIEPKMAFGTGSHETTRMCLKAIREKLKPGARFLDLGCGSGILSILADKMRAGYIKTIDYDLTAIENSRENFSINDVTTLHDLSFGSIDKCRDDQPYDLIAVNIIKSTILDFIPRLIELTASGGCLLLSGLLEADLAVIKEKCEAFGITEFDLIRDNEWFTFVINKG